MAYRERPAGVLGKIPLDYTRPGPVTPRPPRPTAGYVPGVSSIAGYQQPAAFGGGGLGGSFGRFGPGGQWTGFAPSQAAVAPAAAPTPAAGWGDKITAPRHLQGLLTSMGFAPTLQGMMQAVRAGPQFRQAIIGQMQMQNIAPPGYMIGQGGAEGAPAPATPMGAPAAAAGPTQAQADIWNQQALAAAAGGGSVLPGSQAAGAGYRTVAPLPAPRTPPGNPGWGPGPRPVFGRTGW